MAQDNQIVISASRRTDIPAFYMEWFMEGIRKREFEVINPYNRQRYLVPADSEKVHTIVFWSKNFRIFLDRRYGETLEKMGYHLFFNFTVNSESVLLEPNVPPLKDRLDQLGELCRRFGGRAVNWRFDPICFFRIGDHDVRHNLDNFVKISDYAEKSGVERCVTSFMDHYPKIDKRMAGMDGVLFVDPLDEKKVAILLHMETQLLQRKIHLFTCCEKSLVDILPKESTIKDSSCIPNDLLVELYGGRVSLKQDKGQRMKSGCGCMESRDVGSYHLHPCFHNCLFCYANPSNSG